jgi:hypothetical protein
MQKVVNGRVCGPCHACCIVPEIPGLKKAGERCPHLTTKGLCYVYDFRPQVCRDFECGWKLNSKLKEDDRPDLVGLMIMGMPALNLNVVHELRKDATETWKGNRLLKRLAHKRVLGISKFGEPKTVDRLRICGPKSAIDKFDAHARKMLAGQTP